MHLHLERTQQRSQYTWRPGHFSSTAALVQLTQFCLCFRVLHAQSDTASGSGTDAVPPAWHEGADNFWIEEPAWQGHVANIAVMCAGVLFAFWFICTAAYGWQNRICGSDHAKRVKDSIMPKVKKSAMSNPLLQIEYEEEIQQEQPKTQPLTQMQNAQNTKPTKKAANHHTNPMHLVSSAPGSESDAED